VTTSTSGAAASPTPSTTSPDVVRPLTGWGRYPRVACVVKQALGAEALAELVRREEGRRLIARGLGRSYGDAALTGTGVVLDQTRRDRFLSFDPDAGVLRCEAGVSLASILDVFLPRGWCVPVMPGTKHVTVGGAIAADVHGKNHHVDGSFGTWVRGLTLLLASGETLTCAPDCEPEAFWATVGGMGLTGVILTADIQLVRTASAYVRVRFTRTRGLDETLDLLAEGDRHARYSVAWLDALAR
jgi:decaprenylphospho-beta-D-ribofuranose 2-oxidase